MSTTTQTPAISQEQIEQYRDEGYMILERIIPEDTLAMLREECHYFVGYMDGQMDERGETTAGITHRGRRYFVANQYRQSHRLHRFLFSELMAEVCRATLGEQAYLFHEQWVVKGPEQGMKFAWHQDSGYVKFGDSQTRHAPYLTCWCPLDDVSEENGTVYLLPHSRGGTRGRILDHRQEPGTNDLIGYDGDDPGIKLEIPAGSIACFSSYNLHRSGPNHSPNFRRVYLPQYSSEVIRNQQTGEHLNLAVPFLSGGKIIYDPKNDRG